MADRPRPHGQRPVFSGLLALVGVALVVGLIAGGMVLAGTRMLGLDGGGSAVQGQATARESLYLPKPSETVKPTGPQLTLDPGGPTPTGTLTLATQTPTTTSAAPQTGITLVAAQPAVAAMQQIDLSGSYPAGEGAILQVQRFENGAWANFPVTVSVSGGTFATYVQTGQIGETRFRVIDSDTQLASNEVVVQVG